MTYGKKLIFDVATRTSREEDLTPEEMAAADEAAKSHELEQAEFAKTQHLRDRLRDPTSPTLQEKVDALWDAISAGNNDKIIAIQARLKALEAKYPGGA